MASEGELADLAESIAQVGLIQPITLTPDGLVLDGRNRLAACKRVGVEPTFTVREGDDDEYKEFVIGVNTTGRRESMTVQIAAASVALILGHERRKNGRWIRNSITQNPGLQSHNEKEALRLSGTVLDVLGPPYLEEVRDGKQTLNAAYELARKEKERQENAERQRRELAERQEREEEYAREFFASDNRAGDWLAERTGQHKTLYSAFKQYEAENEEIRLAEEARRREEERREQARRDSHKRDADRIRAFLVGYWVVHSIAAGTHHDTDQVLALLDKTDRKLFDTILEETKWPKQRPSVN